MTKQEIYNKFVSEFELVQIHLKQHNFKVILGFKPNIQNQVNIKHRLIRTKLKDLELNVDFGFDVLCTREETTVWKSAYIYNVVLRFVNKETINSVLQDEELKGVFENRQMIQFLWPYLRQELQSDTAKAGIPVFVIPPRK